MDRLHLSKKNWLDQAMAVWQLMHQLGFFNPLFLGLVGSKMKCLVSTVMELLEWDFLELLWVELIGVGAVRECLLLVPLLLLLGVGQCDAELQRRRLDRSQYLLLILKTGFGDVPMLNFLIKIMATNTTMDKLEQRFPRQRRPRGICIVTHRMNTCLMGTGMGMGSLLMAL